LGEKRKGYGVGKSYLSNIESEEREKGGGGWLP